VGSQKHEVWWDGATKLLTGHGRGLQCMHITYIAVVYSS